MSQASRESSGSCIPGACADVEGFGRLWLGGTQLQPRIVLLLVASSFLVYVRLVIIVKVQIATVVNILATCRVELGQPRAGVKAYCRQGHASTTSRVITSFSTGEPIHIHYPMQMLFGWPIRSVDSRPQELQLWQPWPSGNQSPADAVAAFRVEFDACLMCRSCQRISCLFA